MKSTRPLLYISNRITPFTRRLFQLPSAPPQPSLSHSDLPSFLAYATRTNLPESTTFFQGTSYEYAVQSHLRSCAFALDRVGGRADLGIDLTGTWHVGPNPVTDPPVRVFVQCKALKTKLGPNYVRELEGVTAASRRRGGGLARCAGILVSPREATKGVREALGRSGMPLIWIMVERDGKVGQVLWNGRMEEGLGLFGLGVEISYPLALGEVDEEKRGKPDFRLTWEGEQVQTMDEIEKGMVLLEEDWMGKWEERGLGGVSRDEILDAVERIVPGTRPIMISEDDRDLVVRNLSTA
ncbi:hypothetical protein BJX99DRAFT_259853 [Aspergillus californicus]